MENQITLTQKWVQKFLAAFIVMLMSLTSFAQGPNSHGCPGGGHGGPGHGGNHHPTCDAHFIHFRDTVVNGIVFVNAPADSTATYAWDFGDGTTGSTANPSHTYSAPGTYYVCLTVSDTANGGCSNTNCDSVRVFTPAPHCNAHFYHGLDTVANGVRFFNTMNTPGATYAWDFGDGTTSSVEDPSHAYTTAGTYYVCLTVSNSNTGGTCSDTWCDSVHAFTPAPHCNAHFRAFGDSVANEVNFHNGPSSYGATYAWDFGDGITSSSANPTHTYASAGTYWVCLTVSNTNSGGTCTETNCDSVDTTFPTHGGNGGGHHHHHFFRLADGTISTADPLVSLYPNPLVDRATLHLENTSGSATLTIYGMNGQVVISKQVGNGDTELSKGNLNEGLYFYSIDDNGDNVAKGKLRVY